MTGYFDETQATSHHSRHYESCLNSNCSRSPSPIHRQLWEPKHPPSQKLKNHKKLPLKPIDIAKQITNHTKIRDKSSFLPPPCASTPKRSRYPLFTYTINEGPIDNENNSNIVDVNIQKHLDCNFSLPCSGSEAPEPCRPNPPIKDKVATRDLKLELKLDTSRVPPIVTIKNNKVTSNSQQKLQLGSSNPLTIGAKSCPSCSSPRVEKKPGCLCNCCTHPQTCFPQQATKSCGSICLPCPYLSSPRGNLKEDKATSPTNPSCTPPSCHSICRDFPKSYPYLRCPSSKEDKAISPINLCSRSSSPYSLENISPNPTHGHRTSSSDIGSQGTIDIKIDEVTKVQVDWEGDDGPINIDFPILTSHKSRFDDQVHSHDPQLEAFYTSSYNQSRLSSPCRSRSSSPCPPTSARPNSRSTFLNTPWNPCCHIDHEPVHETRSTSISPSRSPCSSLTSFSRGPKSKNLSKRGLSQNSSCGSLDIYSGENGEVVTNLDWTYPRSYVDTQSPFSKLERFNCMTKEQQLNSPNQSSSPMLTITPHTRGNSQMTIEWNNPRLVQEKRCKELDPQTMKEKGSKGCCKDFESSYYHDEVEKDERELNPQSFVQVYSHTTSPTSKLGYKTCRKYKDLLCTSSCKPTCALTPCTPPCDPCQGSSSCCNFCCCNKNCIAPTQGVNKCTSLPPHLQSDWSASLRCPLGQVRNKPILYRDTKGHEHIMFADGSIEHLSQHCESTIPSQQQPSQPLPFEMPCASGQFLPPSPCQHTFNHKGGKSDQYLVDKFSPQSGDIVIRAHQRLPCMHPNKDNGQVAFFTSDYLDLQEGDSIVRLGKFDSCGQWCSSKLVEMYLRGSHGQWMFLGTTEGYYVLSPLEADKHQIVRTPNKQLQLRPGDLVINSFPRPNSFYFWKPKMKLDCDHSDLLLRAYIGQPQVEDENHNLACCVGGHLPVGYVELYVKVKRIWLFLGRDDHMFSEHELMYFS